MERSRTGPHMPPPHEMTSIVPSGSFESQQSANTRRSMDTRRSSLDPRRLSSFVTGSRRKATPEEEALLLSQATSQAMIAAKSMLMSGATPNTALTTAKAAAESILSPKGTSSAPYINRRKAKQQASVVASMALMSAQNDTGTHIATGGLGSPMASPRGPGMHGGSSVYDMSEIGMDQNFLYPHSPFANSRSNTGYHHHSYGMGGSRVGGSSGGSAMEPPSVIPRNFKQDDPSTMGSEIGGASGSGGSRIMKHEDNRMHSGRKMAVDTMMDLNGMGGSGSGSAMMRREDTRSSGRKMAMDKMRDDFDAMGSTTGGRSVSGRSVSGRSVSERRLMKRKEEENRRRGGETSMDKALDSCTQSSSYGGGRRYSYGRGEKLKRKGSSASRVSRLLDSTHCGTDDDVSHASHDEYKYNKSFSASGERQGVDEAFSSFSDAQDSFSSLDESVAGDKPSKSVVGYDPFSYLFKSINCGFGASTPQTLEKRGDEEARDQDERREPLDAIMRDGMEDNEADDDKRVGEDGKASDNASMKSMNSAEIVRALETFERERMVPGTSMKQPQGDNNLVFRSLQDGDNQGGPAVDSTSGDDSSSAQSSLLKKTSRMPRRPSLTPRLGQLGRWRLPRKFKPQTE